MLSLCPKEFAAEHEWPRSIELTKKQSRSSAAFMVGTCLSLHRRGIGPSMKRTIAVALRTLAAQAKSEDPLEIEASNLISSCVWKALRPRLRAAPSSGLNERLAEAIR